VFEKGLMKNKPAGWYRNPDDPRQHAYWNGEAWVDPSELEPPSRSLPTPADDEVDGEDTDDAP
jgi:hypothetical protein